MNITNLPSIRTTDFLAFTLCTLLLGIAIYLEVFVHLEPCPLCIMQRIVFIALAVLFLMGSMLPLRRRVSFYFHFFISLIAILGIITAGRQVWLEHLPPDQIPSCGANIKYLFQVLPFHQALQVVFQGTGSCAKVTWRFLGLSMPAWSLLFFIFFTGLAIWQSRRPGSTSVPPAI